MDDINQIKTMKLEHRRILRYDFTRYRWPWGLSNLFIQDLISTSFGIEVTPEEEEILAEYGKKTFEEDGVLYTNVRVSTATSYALDIRALFTGTTIDLWLVFWPWQMHQHHGFALYALDYTYVL